MLNLLQPWVNKQRRVVIADRYFALVQACGDIRKRGLRFIGVVKTENRGLCMEKLSEIELAQRGMWKGYFTLDNEKKLEKSTFVWVDIDQRYFISNNSSLKPGITCARERLKHVDYSLNADPVRIEFEINQPRVAVRYYSRNFKIDESKRTRKDDLQLERNIQTKDFSIIVNT